MTPQGLFPITQDGDHRKDTSEGTPPPTNGMDPPIGECAGEEQAILGRRSILKITSTIDSKTLRHFAQTALIGSSRKPSQYRCRA
jgi:hypothetical protein